MMQARTNTDRGVRRALIVLALMLGMMVGGVIAAPVSAYHSGRCTPYGDAWQKLYFIGHCWAQPYLT